MRPTVAQMRGEPDRVHLALALELTATLTATLLTALTATLLTTTLIFFTFVSHDSSPLFEVFCSIQVLKTNIRLELRCTLSKQIAAIKLGVKVVSKRSAMGWFANAVCSSHNLVIVEAQMSSSSCRNLFCSSFR